MWLDIMKCVCVSLTLAESGILDVADRIHTVIVVPVEEAQLDLKKRHRETDTVIAIMGLNMADKQTDTETETERGTVITLSLNMSGSLHLPLLSSQDCVPIVLKPVYFS